MRAHVHTYRYTPVITHTDKHLDLVTGLERELNTVRMPVCVCVCVCVCTCVYKWGVWGILGCRLFGAGGCVEVHFHFFFLPEPLEEGAHFTKSQKLKVGHRYYVGPFSQTQRTQTEKVFSFF